MADDFPGTEFGSRFADGLVSLAPKKGRKKVTDVTRTLRTSIDHLRHFHQPHEGLLAAAERHLEIADVAAKVLDYAAFACACWNAGLLVGGAAAPTMALRREEVVRNDLAIAAKLKKVKAAAQGVGFENVKMLNMANRALVAKFTEVRPSCSSDRSAFKKVADQSRRLGKPISYKSVERAVMQARRDA